VLFNWNDRPHMLRRAIDLAKSAGVDSISFCPTTSPVYGVSWRYYLQPFHRQLGEPTWKGREVHFAARPGD
jgi:O-acetyl-ADP-ribose deacetylase (regulator of RNase III)